METGMNSLKKRFKIFTFTFQLWQYRYYSAEYCFLFLVEKVYKSTKKDRVIVPKKWHVSYGPQRKLSRKSVG